MSQKLVVCQLCQPVCCTDNVYFLCASYTFVSASTKLNPRFKSASHRTLAHVHRVQASMDRKLKAFTNPGCRYSALVSRRKCLKFEALEGSLYSLLLERGSLSVMSEQRPLHLLAATGDRASDFCFCCGWVPHAYAHVCLYSIRSFSVLDS
ncbi:hypothetical protein BJ741DRAFT_423303 [Chytriomyces cf. hyalinus JEL632]|nr:hypothetical protein BJ741DRAFT_423303 [Chytriomyces cf. hyalinus JEL632]